MASAKDAASLSSAPVDHASNLCSYCTQLIDNDSFLHCLQCGGNVHIKCLRHAGTPGDLLGDVFFDFTCANCMQLQYKDGGGPASSSSSAGGSESVREKFARQRLPWLMVITLTLFNLSIKSKGLSHHGYFHWRTHIVNFIDKNWDYLFEPTTRRRKNWIGSISGALSHNNPQFFLSGQEVFNEPGWWKLTYCNQTPKFIFKIYEQICLKRQQLRSDKRQLEDTASYASDSANDVQDAKRLRRSDSCEDAVQPTDSCSRTIPYMGRKPKVAKQLNIVDDDISKNLQQQQQQQQQPLSTVQSSLMDFLAENFANDDLNMFSSLPNIATEPLVGVGKNEFLPLLEAHNENANFFDVPEIKHETLDFHEYEFTSHMLSASKHKEQYDDHQQQQKPQEQRKPQQKPQRSGKISYEDQDNNYLQENSLQTPSEYSNDADADEFQPRIVQITNFQLREEEEATNSKSPNQNLATLVEPTSTSKQIKREIESESESEETATATVQCNGTADVPEAVSALGPCKPSLFTKTPRRNWPWLVQKTDTDAVEVTNENVVDKAMQSNESIVMMSEYEEKELLHKLRKIVASEESCRLQIPTYVRRFHRKLCVREWNREHLRPLFNLDEQLDGNRNLRQIDNAKAKIIDRYQLIALTPQDTRKSFYARIAGSSQHELFESPYTQRILHPFIYRNTKCFPPWLKLMCEVQYAATSIVPKRASVDYCYVRPHHIAAVNALLQTVFWPGIDMSECLSYPDFSVVALYKKLVVGCGFLVPDVGFNEAYISFMAVRPGWQRSGIATFMLYHLIQTCMSKDITLHVSASNPAVVLYQKFGFKIEEVILDFYDKYLPIDSKHSRHAFFLRLMR